MNGLTPSQTVGPYFRIGLDWPDAWRLARADEGVATLILRGQLRDGDGAPVPDALLEIWQADGAGRYHPSSAEGFRGLGRRAVDAEGRYQFETIMPGAVPGSDGRPQAPHINLLVMARGLLQHLYTRVYFAEHAHLHGDDAVLACVPAARRSTLLAEARNGEYHFDIHLQGEHETVFFAL